MTMPVAMTALLCMFGKHRMALRWRRRVLANGIATNVLDAICLRCKHTAEATGREKWEVVE